MNRQEISSRLDKVILLLLTIQVSFVSLSIAISSIAFGGWLGLWLIKIILNGSVNFDRILFSEIKSVNLFILLYIFFEILSRFFAVYPEGAFANLKRLLLFLIFFVSIIEISDKKTLFRILIVNLVMISLISIAELVQYIFKFSELISKMSFSEIRIDYFNYPLTTAEIKMMSMLSVFPLMFIKGKFLIDKKYLVLLLIPVFISMILTQSRNVLLATFICFIITGIVLNRKFLLSMIAVIVLSYFILPSSYIERVKSIADINHPSNASRLNMWSVGLRMFSDHPFTGIADSHILEIYGTYKKPEFQSEGVHLHNNFIMILATTGIFGFLSFIAMFILIFIKQIIFYRDEKSGTDKMLILGSILVMISFQISGIFEWSFGDHEVMTVFFFLIAVPFVIFKLNKI
ncbi:MAG TPA: O-antigen ligase family protein [Ignavibacteria bacterium]|nr:O-antigen ligase family protein [Ignavibacteria bacterium]